MIDSVFDYGNAYTMAGYFKIVDGGSGSLMGNSNGNAFGNFLGFVYKSGDDSNFYPDGSSSNFVTIYSGNTTGFVYIVCTSDGTTAKAYLNGEFVGSTSVSSYTNTGSQFNVGSSYSGNFGEHEAAGVKIFNTALTAAQVADLYLNPEKIVPDGVADSALKLWLPMMEGAGTLNLLVTPTPSILMVLRGQRFTIMRVWILQARLLWRRGCIMIAQ
jgi:hypothetical protein